MGYGRRQSVQSWPARNVGSAEHGYELRGFLPVELLFHAAGQNEQVAPELCGPACRWRSLTPYLPVRHHKRESLADYLTADAHTELGYRDLPLASAEPDDPVSRLPDRWALAFRRYRLTEKHVQVPAGPAATAGVRRGGRRAAAAEAAQPFRVRHLRSRRR
jgi:hypothetical protein